MTQSEASRDLMDKGPACLRGLDVLQDELDAVQHLDGAVLCDEVFSHRSSLHCLLLSFGPRGPPPMALLPLWPECRSAQQNSMVPLIISMTDSKTLTGRSVCLVIGFNLRNRGLSNYLAHLLMDVDVGGQVAHLWCTNPETPAP